MNKYNYIIINKVLTYMNKRKKNSINMNNYNINILIIYKKKYNNLNIKQMLGNIIYLEAKIKIYI